MAKEPNTPSDTPTPEPEPQKVIGLRGEPVNMPSGTWYAQTDGKGNLTRKDGYLVKDRD